MKSRHCNKAWQSYNLIPLTHNTHIFLPWLIFDSTVQSVLLFNQLTTHSSHLGADQIDTTPFQYLKCPLASAMQHVAWRLCISILSWSYLNCNLSTIFHCTLHCCCCCGVTDALRPNNSKPCERIHSCSSNISGGEFFYAEMFFCYIQFRYRYLSIYGCFSILLLGFSVWVLR